MVRSLPRFVDVAIADPKEGIRTTNNPLPCLSANVLNACIFEKWMSQYLVSSNRPDRSSNQVWFSWARPLLRSVVGAMFIKKRRRVSCRSEEHTSELQSQFHLVCRLLLEKK